MEKRTLLGTSFLILTAVAVIHHLALELKFYFTLCWLDLVVHFLAALGLVFVLLWFLFLSGCVNASPLKSDYVLLLGFTTMLLVGGLWELFELWAGISSTSFYYVDTLLDILSDVLGGVAAAALFVKTYIV